MTYIRIDTKTKQAKKFVELIETMPFAEILSQQFCQHLMFFDTLSKRFTCVQLHYTHLMPCDTF